MDNSKMTQYDWFDQVPEGLATKTQLSQEGMRPGGEPIAYVYWRRRDKVYYLYEREHAIPKRQMSPAQAAALERARAAAWANRHTCEHCGAVDSSVGDVYCESDDGPIKIGRFCGDCTSLQYELDDIDDLVLRAADAANAVEQARRILEQPDHAWCVLDTETTGLDATDEVVQVAVLAPNSTILLNTLVRPSCPISAGAMRVHGITDEMLADAPTFAEVYPRLAAAVAGRQVVIYNAQFDSRILGYCCDANNLPRLPAASYRCAMHWYAPYVGDWSEYHGDYKWPRLVGGDHTALGDCRATLALIQRVARDDQALVEVERLIQRREQCREQWASRSQGEV